MVCGIGSKLYILLWRCVKYMLFLSLCLIIDGINGVFLVSVFYKFFDLFMGFYENINLVFMLFLELWSNLNYGFGM